MPQGASDSRCPPRDPMTRRCCPSSSLLGPSRWTRARRAAWRRAGVAGRQRDRPPPSRPRPPPVGLRPGSGRRPASARRRRIWPAHRQDRGQGSRDPGHGPAPREPAVLDAAASNGDLSAEHTAAIADAGTADPGAEARLVERAKQTSVPESVASVRAPRPPLCPTSRLAVVRVTPGARCGTGPMSMVDAAPGTSALSYELRDA